MMRFNLTFVRRSAGAVVVALCVLAAGDYATAQCQYEVSAIIEPEEDCSPFPNSLVYGRGMNAHGEVAGHYVPCAIGDERAFFWSESTGFVTLPTPPGVVQAYANDVNDSRMIVGSHLINGVGWTGFVYDPNTRGFTYLQPLHDGHGQTQTVSTLNAINNAGIAVGARLISKPGVTPAVTNAVIWNTNTGEVTDLGVGEGPNSLAVDGNNATDAAGWSGSSPISTNARALIWSDTVLIELGMLPGTIQSTARSISIQQDAIGSCREPNLGPFVPFLWTKGKMKPFPIPDGYHNAGASDLNDVGQFTGAMAAKPGAPWEHFIFQHGEFYNLADLIVDSPPNLNLTSTTRIGNGGQILGRAGTVAVLLAPIGQPTGDLNFDCRVDVHDLLILLDAWGPVPRAARQTGSPADLNGDGVVNVSDLLILLANWSH